MNIDAVYLTGPQEAPARKRTLPEHVYDDGRQIWIDKNSGVPLVVSMRTRAQPTQFGETTLTETRGMLEARFG